MVIQPLALSIPLVFLMRNVLGISSSFLPTPLFILLSLSLWVYIRRGTYWMTKSPMMHGSVLGRAYVPFLLIMIASLTPAFFEFFVVLLLSFFLASYYTLFNGIMTFTVGLHNLLIIVAFVLATLLAISISCFTSILNSLARDTGMVMRYLMTLWMLVSAIFYPIGVIPADLLIFALLNPLMPIVDLFRAGFTGRLSIEPYFILITILQVLGCLWFALRFFIRYQHIIYEKSLR
jgi:ABC-type polysaccharide/polyol phosphate export permease